MKKLLTLSLVFVLALSFLAETGALAASKPTQLSFLAANDINELKALNGKKVTIMGYMATLSPLDGHYMYLMNMPYQSCPFCVPNTTQLANTMAVYAKKKKKFEFTDRAIRVTGTLKVEDYEDEYGYRYNYRIVDATMEIVDTSELGERYVLWQTLAADGVVADINAALDYLYFVCCWTDYTFNFYDENGEYHSEPMWPGDAMMMLESEDEYGYARETQDDYFPALVRRVKGISSELTDLTDLLERADTLKKKAIDDLYAEHFTWNEETGSYTQDNYYELCDEFYVVFNTFSEWLASWEM